MPKTFRDLLKGTTPILMPVATDALSARLIGRGGFDAFAIGGFPLVGS
ncbi:MAG: carboxyvinyl-carboxyphosphonate phosphorylmutase, partial [Alphaproteobacteria bacterium]|nr:carboxyvinyl-carboxyphosphonate phosphorylmutase [Alphaproteobacteria bacterium]